LIGPVVGFNRSMHSVDLASFVDDPLCPYFQSGSANGFYAGLSFEYLLGDPARSKSSIILKVLYSTMPANLQVTGDEYPSRVLDAQGNDQIIYSSTEHTVDVAYDMLTFEPLYKLNLFESNFGIVVGPTIDLTMTSTRTQKMSLIEPLEAQFIEKPGYTYEDDFRTIVVADGDIPESSGLRLGVKAGVQYEILFQGFYVVPHVFYNFGVTQLSSAEDWRVNAIQMGVDVRFAL
ncbi:MAG: hypothetical protein ACOCX7_02405, partial [Bacteroidota bacterium]